MLNATWMPSSGGFVYLPNMWYLAITYLATKSSPICACVNNAFIAIINQ